MKDLTLTERIEELEHEIDCYDGEISHLQDLLELAKLGAKQRLKEMSVDDALDGKKIKAIGETIQYVKVLIESADIKRQVVKNKKREFEWANV